MVRITLQSIGLDRVDGLSPQEQSMLNDTITIWANKIIRNKLRMKYYDGNVPLKDFGVSIPPKLRNIDTSIGWPAKAVDVLAARSVFSGFGFKDGELPEIDAVVRDCDLRGKYQRAVVDELKCSCAFLTVSKGASDEPAVIVSEYNALVAAAMWDFRRNRIKCGVTIVDIASGTNTPTWVNFFTDEATIQMRRATTQTDWEIERLPHLLGRPLMEPLVYNPSTERPFGTSRISRPVMSITDEAQREALRTAVAAEFYTAPQRYMIGVDDETFKKMMANKWEQYTGTTVVTTTNDEGENPVYGQLPQMTMQPHLDYMRQLASRFAGESGIPLEALGFHSDANPASAEAMYAAENNLVREASTLNQSNGIAMRNIGLMALAIIRNRPINQLDDNDLSIMPKFERTHSQSPATMADYLIKLGGLFEGFGESSVAMELAGFTEEQIARMKQDRRRSQSMAIRDQLDKAINNANVPPMPGISTEHSHD
jgi:hypothetical protein